MLIALGHKRSKSGLLVVRELDYIEVASMEFQHRTHSKGRSDEAGNEVGSEAGDLVEPLEVFLLLPWGSPVPWGAQLLAGADHRDGGSGPSLSPAPASASCTCLSSTLLDYLHLSRGRRR